MTEIPISLIKKKYASIASAAAASGSVQGAIVFDKAHKVICVNGDVYGGNITDATFTNHQLVITKADGTNITLDFSDVASAQGTMTVFGQIRDAIGVGNDMSVQGQYANTHYLQGVQTLVNADKKLDEVLTQVQGTAEQAQGQAEAAQGLAEQVQGEAEAAQGLAEQVQGQVEALQQAVIDNENVTVQAVEAIQKATGLNNQLQYVLPQDAWATQGAASIAEAVAQLDSTMQGIVNDDKTYTIEEQSTAEEGFFKTYYLQETVGGVGTQAGVKINIPKDFLVKDAEVKTVTAADKAEGGIFYNNPDFEVGDKYIDFTVNAKAAQTAGEETHIYLNVKDLVDVYTPEQNATEVQLAIDANNVISATIVNGAVSTDKLADGAVQSAKIADGAVTSPKLAVQAVQSANIADGAVDTDKIADGAVQTAKIGAQAVTSEKIGAQGVQGWNIAQGAITSDKLDDNLVHVEANTPEIKVNDPDNAGTTQGVTIATIGGKEVKAKVGMYWSEWSDDEPTPEP